MICHILIAVTSLAVGLCTGFLICHTLCKKKIDDSFYDGFNTGRSFYGFDDWFRENFPDRYGE